MRKIVNTNTTYTSKWLNIRAIISTEGLAILTIPGELDDRDNDSLDIRMEERDFYDVLNFFCELADTLRGEKEDEQ